MEAWDFLLAGGGLYNNLDYSFTVGHEDGTFVFPATQPGGGGAALRRQLRVLRDFLLGFDFLRLAPEPGLVTAGVPAGGSARALAQAGQSYAVYLRRLASAGSFSARWTGVLLPPRTGEYSLHTVSNDGVRLRIDGQVVIEDWTDHGEKEDTARVRLQAGRAHRVDLEYFYNGGQGVMKLLWTPPSEGKGVVPASALRGPEGSGQGLRGEYFEGSGLERAWFTRADPQVDFAFGTEGPVVRTPERGAGAFALDIPRGDWRITWLDPVSGNLLREETTTGGAPLRIVAPPWGDDVALAIRRVDPASR
jgi:hypothetical protein